MLPYSPLMSLFSNKLRDIESRLFDNLRKTKAVFPEEIVQLEVGLELMRNLTKVSYEAVNEYPKRPNLYTNHNLFSRNRQLLLNSYTSLLFSSYGTEFVIVRTVLENNNLMRLFNKNPQFAFEWLPQILQNRFPDETKAKFGVSGKSERRFRAEFVRNGVFGEKGKEKVKDDIETFYADLCNYTHPNFNGWKELVFREQNSPEMIQNMPRFQVDSAEVGVGVALFSMQTTFKAIAETFKGYWHWDNFAFQLTDWQNRNLIMLPKYLPSEVNDADSKKQKA